MAEFYEVETPIVNDAYQEPAKHWVIRKGEPPVLKPGRRPGSYFWRPSTKAQREEHPDGVVMELDIVNRIRSEMKRWKADGYPGASEITRELLAYWERAEREKPVVFCQREAAESIIFLREAAPQYKQGLVVPRDEPSEAVKADGYAGFERLCIKMATGAGKTTVMAMLSAWSILNHQSDRKSDRYTDTILVLCPSVTIRERLAELEPQRGNASTYRQRDLVPPARMPDLARGRVVITNWHVLQPHEGHDVGGVTAAVVQKGQESDRALVDRVLGPSLRGKKNLLVFNDEGHHAYRLPPEEKEEEDLMATDDEEEERREATVWIQGLDKVQKERGLRGVIDLSATPIVRYGPDAGKVFPWVVSDFALVDAIECGLVKIPQLPVADSTGRDVPTFFNIWDWIVDEKLSATERGGRRGQVSPDAIVRHAAYPIQRLADDWRKTFEEWKSEAQARRRDPVPPVFIIVCRDTKLARALHEAIATPKPGEPAMVPEFVNSEGHENTVRVDSKVVAEIESGAKSQEARRLRFILDTVGRSTWPDGRPPLEWETLARELGQDPEVPPGRDVRCIISVGMLTEGWDCRTVTHIVGLRPFRSQLLCEQVVGRALRRAQWHDLRIEEVARILGVPFEVIPFKAARPKPSGEAIVTTHVKPRPDRSHLAISFPRVERFLPIVKDHLKAVWDRVPDLVLDPMEIPSEVLLKSFAIDEQGRLTRSGIGKGMTLTLDGARSHHRIQHLEYQLATHLCKQLAGPLGIPAGRAFNELLPIVRHYLAKKVKGRGGYQALDISLYRPWYDKAFEALAGGIGSADAKGEVGELPVYERSRPVGSTLDVDFWTSRDVTECVKSHLNYAVADTIQWEQVAAFYLEQNELVVSYAKNFDMGFSIPYLLDGERHDYLPDYLVRLSWQGLEVGTLMLEVKGMRDERARATEVAARRWVDAVNKEGSQGVWDYAIAYNPNDVADLLRTSAEWMSLQKTKVPSAVVATRPRSGAH